MLYYKCSQCVVVCFYAIGLCGRIAWSSFLLLSFVLLSLPRTVVWFRRHDSVTAVLFFQLPNFDTIIRDT